MTHNNDSNLLAEAMEHVIENGLDGLSDAVTFLLNEAMLIGRSRKDYTKFDLRIRRSGVRIAPGVLDI